MKKFALFGALLAACSMQATPPGWLDSYDAALKFSARTHKPVLLDFTGSDWCGWCKKMRHETLDKKDFVSYASTNLILVEVDFPNSIPQSDAVKAANEKLKEEFGVRGFPTFILVNSQGKELGRQSGYLAGGVAAFTGKIDHWKDGVR